MIAWAKGLIERIRAWSHAGGSWRTWGVTHPLAWEAFIVGAVLVAFVVEIVFNPHPIWLVPIALTGDSAGSYFYGDRERGDFTHHLQARNWSGVADSVLDFVVPRILTAFTWVAWAWLYFEVTA